MEVTSIKIRRTVVGVMIGLLGLCAVAAAQSSEARADSCTPNNAGGYTCSWADTIPGHDIRYFGEGSSVNGSRNWYASQATTTAAQPVNKCVWVHKWASDNIYRYHCEKGFTNSIKFPRCNCGGMMTGFSHPSPDSVSKRILGMAWH